MLILLVMQISLVTFIQSLVKDDVVCFYPRDTRLELVLAIAAFACPPLKLRICLLLLLLFVCFVLAKLPSSLFSELVVWRRGVVVSGVRQRTKLTHVGPGYNWDW